MYKLHKLKLQRILLFLHTAQNNNKKNINMLSSFWWNSGIKPGLGKREKINPALKDL
jgi:hypothetical protein